MTRRLTSSSATCVGILLLGLALTPNPAQAQFGVRGGVSLSSLFGGDVSQADTRQGLTGGFSTTLLTLGPLSLGPEVHYVQKGSELTQLNPEALESFQEFGLDYVEVPVMLRLGIPLPFGDGGVRGYAEGGPAFAWRVNCTISPDAGGVGLSDECAFAQFQDAETVVTSADRGAVVGGGLIVELPMVGGFVTLDGRLVRGLTRLGAGEDGLQARNQAFSLTLGYDLGAFR
jgi:hypothetical protein